MTDTAEGAGFPAPRFQPGRLWSLWEMLEHFAHTFLSIGEVIGEIELHIMFDDTDRANPPMGAIASEEPAPVVVTETTREGLQKVAALCRKLEVNVSADLIEAALKTGKPATQGEFALIKQALYSEIKARRLFYIPSERAKYWENADLLSAPARAKFPTASAELREGANCFAAGRFTATVLHAMRSAEVGVKAMSRALGHNPPDLAQQDWHPVLTKCESIIQEMRDKMKKGPDKEVELQFYSQAAAQFRHFKDGWRVQAAHSRAPFNEGEARIILDATVSFYEVLAAGLSEDAQEIARGQSAP